MTDETQIIKIQALFRRRLARNHVETLAQSIYEQYYDETYGAQYYVDVRTGASTWTRPGSLGAKGDEDVSDELTKSSSFDQDQESIMDEPRSFVEQERLSEEGKVRFTIGQDERLDEEPEEVMAEQQPEQLLRPKSSLRLEREKQAGLKRQNARDLRLKMVEKKRLEISMIDARVQLRASLEAQHRRELHKLEKRRTQEANVERQVKRETRNEMLKQHTKVEWEKLYRGETVVILGSLRDAALRGNADRVLDLLAQGYDPNAASAMGLTPLVSAARAGHAHICRILLQHRAQVNQRHLVTGRTVLMEACSRLNVDVMRELLRFGARLHLRDLKGQSAEQEIQHPEIQAAFDAASNAWNVRAHPLFPLDFQKAVITWLCIQFYQRRARARRVAHVRIQARVDQARLWGNWTSAKLDFETASRSTIMCGSVPEQWAIVSQAYEALIVAQRSVLTEVQTIAVAFAVACLDSVLSDRVVHLILSFCPRHWFDQHSAEGKRYRRVQKGTCVDDQQQPRSSRVILPLRRIRYDQLLEDYQVPLGAMLERLNKLHDQILVLQATEHPDVHTGVSYDAAGQSQAALEIQLIRGKHLPRRCNRLRDCIDPMVTFTAIGDKRLKKSANAAPAVCISSEPRFQTSDPIWNQSLVLEDIPSIQSSIQIELFDFQKDTAGRCVVDLRHFLDQMPHQDTYVFAPTLKQQLIEQEATREFSAELEIQFRLVYNQRSILTRQLKKAIKEFHVYFQSIQTKLDTQIQDYMLAWTRNEK